MRCRAAHPVGAWYDALRLKAAPQLRVCRAHGDRHRDQWPCTSAIGDAACPSGPIHTDVCVDKYERRVCSRASSTRLPPAASAWFVSRYWRLSPHTLAGAAVQLNPSCFRGAATPTHTVTHGCAQKTRAQHQLGAAVLEAQALALRAVSRTSTPPEHGRCHHIIKKSPLKLSRQNLCRAFSSFQHVCLVCDWSGGSCDVCATSHQW